MTLETRHPAREAARPDRRWGWGMAFAWALGLAAATMAAVLSAQEIMA